MIITPTNPDIIHAKRAAENYNNWGRFAALRYCQRRNVPMRLYYLCRLLHAAKEFA